MVGLAWPLACLSGVCRPRGTAHGRSRRAALPVPGRIRWLKHNGRRRRRTPLGPESVPPWEWGEASLMSSVLSALPAVTAGSVHSYAPTLQNSGIDRLTIQFDGRRWVLASPAAWASLLGLHG